MPKVVPEYKEEARKKILTVARAEFARKGYRDAKLEDIAKKVGVSKAAIYTYFENKEELMSAIAGSAMAEAVANEFSPRRKEGAAEVIRGSFGRLLEWAPDSFPCLVGDIMSEGQRDGKARIVFEKVDEMLMSSIVSFLNERKRMGEIPEDYDSVKAARVFLALQGGLLQRIAVGLPRKEAIATWEKAIDMMTATLVRQR